LIVPLVDHNQKVIGVLQLINKKDILGRTISFDEKSPYTSGHITRMVDLSVMIAKSLNFRTYLSVGLITK